MFNYVVRGKDKDFALTFGQLVKVSCCEDEAIGWFSGYYSGEEYVKLSVTKNADSGYGGYFSVCCNLITKVEVLDVVNNRLERSAEVSGEQSGSIKAYLESLYEQPSDTADPPGPVEEPRRSITWREFL